MLPILYLLCNYHINAVFIMLYYSSFLFYSKSQTYYMPCCTDLALPLSRDKRGAQHDRRVDLCWTRGNVQASGTLRLQARDEGRCRHRQSRALGAWWGLLNGLTGCFQWYHVVLIVSRKLLIVGGEVALSSLSIDWIFFLLRYRVVRASACYHTARFKPTSRKKREAEASAP